ncbi:serine hydrolase [Pseudoalteromonas sp. OOF1S-7]|uniref:serine hydrolase n=1 Tax=Pseudoalteromonas sp. OOF1S-7 TaxID=2917757 RepID=UPI001EF4A099|nr:serine hydrolase [Pseudoalteromonas sp. OOF1S-7]MCG7535395.1 serine hydrolase [Pseudoalteromonas sp. OOF1S-7]
MKLHALLTLACALTLNPLSALASTPQQAADYIADYIERTPELGPGFGMVVVNQNKVLLNKVWGKRRAGTNLPVTPQTPLYIASQTKAYMGLVAAHLHHQKVLDLYAPLSQFWPASSFPEGVDAKQWRLIDLLSHQVPVSADFVTEMEAYMTEVAVDDYPWLVKRYGKKRDEGFEYDNLGYNIYGAILQQVTGRSWQDWLATVLFKPFNMPHSSARTSDFAADEVAWNHIWQGSEAGWTPVPPKTDAMMHSAGGIVTSTSDITKWLQLNLSAGQGSISAADLALSHKQAVALDPQARNVYRIPCHGYSLGWNICTFKGYSVLIHGGGYTGSRSLMAIVPELKIGLATFSNSDNMTGRYTIQTIKQYLLYLLDAPEYKTAERENLSTYQDKVAKLLNRRQQRLNEAEQADHWQQWRYTPSKKELANYAGHYRGDNTYLDLTLTVNKDHLSGHSFDYRFTLKPATQSRFALYDVPFAQPQPVEFKLNEEGKPVSLEWAGRVYQRQ